MRSRSVFRRTILGAALTASSLSHADAQTVAYDVGEDMLLARQPAGQILLEPHLATHPSDPNALLAVGWVHLAGNAAPASEHCATFFSSDGGRHWTRTDLASVSCSDAWVSMTESGTAVLTALGTHRALANPGNNLVAYFSRDSGRTWNDVPQGLGGGFDGPRSVAAPDGTIYVVSGQGANEFGKLRSRAFVGRVARGRAYVETMSRVLPSNLAQLTDGVTVLSDGTLVIAYNDYQRAVPDGGFRSREGALETTRTWVMSSSDRGESFSFPLMVTEKCCFRPTFMTADTSSGPFRDRLYTVCQGDEQRAVLVMHSDDHR